MTSVATPPARAPQGEGEQELDLEALLASAGAALGGVSEIDDDNDNKSSQEMEPWEAMVDRIRFKDDGPLDVNFRPPSETTSAYEVSAGFDELDISQLAAVLAEPDAELWDVREPEEFVAGHLAGSISVPLANIGDAVSPLEGAGPSGVSSNSNKGRRGRICLICATGQRSAQAQVRLRHVYGLDNVCTIRGGIMAWEALGGDLEMGR